MLTLVNRFRNATSLDSMTEHYASLSRQCKATERSENASPADHTLPRLPEVYRMPIADTSVFRTRSAAVVLATVLANDLLQNNIRVFTIIYYICNNCIILHIFMLVVLLLPSCY